MQGNRLFALLQNWTAQLPAEVDFDKLPVPFRTVATDLGSGQPVVFDHGSLPTAIRASVAVPGLFAPIRVGGRTLVDGGLVSNLPVQLARDMGADVVIAVNVGSPLEDPASLNSPADVTQQMVTILMNQNVATQKGLLHGSDVLLEPQLGDLSFTDFACQRRRPAGWLATASQRRRRWRWRPKPGRPIWTRATARPNCRRWRASMASTSTRTATFPPAMCANT